MKVTTPIYLQVKVEVEFDNNEMSKEEAIEEATESFDYNFKLNEEFTNIKVIDTEIQEILEESYE